MLAPHTAPGPLIGSARASNEAASAGPQLRSILLDDISSKAGQAIAKAVWSTGSQVAVHAVTVRTAERYVKILRAGSCLPVGTPSLTQRCLELAGRTLPPWDPHPTALHPYMVHGPRRTTASAALRSLGPCLIEPLTPGLFRPFVHQLTGPDSAAGNPDLQALLALDRRTPVCVSTPISVVCTWRYYVLAGDVLGGTYIGGVHKLEPHLEEVVAIVAAAPTATGYAADVGVLEDGSSTLLRLHDPLTLEPPELLDGPDLRALSFVRLVWTRWASLFV